MLEDRLAQEGTCRNLNLMNHPLNQARVGSIDMERFHLEMN